MTNQSSSGETDLYTLPILCMLKIHLKNHVKINTVLWHPNYNVDKDNKKKQTKQVHVIWIKNDKGEVVPATVWKEPERIKCFHDYLIRVGYTNTQPGVPVADELKGRLSDFDKESCVMKPLKDNMKAAPTQVETNPENRKRKAKDNSSLTSLTRSRKSG